MKNCDLGLESEMLPSATGRGQHFQARGHSFKLYGPTVSWQITYLFFPCDKLTYNWVYPTLSLNWPVLRAAYEPGIVKNLTRERASKLNLDVRQRKMY